MSRLLDSVLEKVAVDNTWLVVRVCVYVHVCVCVGGGTSKTF